jgi:hypothetical protein
MKTCSVVDCNKPVDARTLCHTHYEWLRRNPGSNIEDYSAPRPKQYHGMTGTPEYRAWLGMLARCYNPNVKYYERYGGRGIKVCDEWRNSFENFYAYIGPRPKGTSVNRIDNDKGYEPGNVEWATQQTQVRNRGLNSRNKSGVTGVHWDKRAKRWIAELHIGNKRLLYRHFRNLDDAITVRKEAENKYMS